LARNRKLFIADHAVYPLIAQRLYYIFDETALLIAEDGKNLLKRSKPIAFMACGKYWVNNHAHIVTGIGQVDLDYLGASLDCRDISDFVTGIDQWKLTRANLDRIPIQIPPLSLQQRFSQIVQKLERLRAQQREAERQAEHLFGSLLGRAFRGEI
jgi:type I restriction enzyme S subunit